MNPQEGENVDDQTIFSLASKPEFGLLNEKRQLEKLHILGFLEGGTTLNRVAGWNYEPGDPDLEAIKDDLPSKDNMGHAEAQPGAFIKGYLKEKILEDFRSEGTVAHYFVCNLQDAEEHWILIVVLKLARGKPIMLILDSYNILINERSDATIFIEYLYTTFVKPFQLNNSKSS